ncbi:bifunctional UDP-N-acetylglucosamine diphosphorylase/glucosamine-1-phosphate N-acetyltransferase GlmU [Stappia sp. MMSF_3263]|uniref:bifunctional UDP-N-acetylglucosamine diphosphorylase/glucosamine-1-phosphate N-acetyltransferase GlmU n=1 Tax=Stappia sp. MMSF_3263 TaxID=3046693 RepID=UPI00273EE295|nr:bifunctional UDP-N-acetylglucosamine diphosphorylase/glucosamine-1-phosphate N-acetyltransferase GlmU [Stappia sp. MMSF_3263]
MPHNSRLAIVLAAGLGTRMKSERPKVMHEVANLSLVGHVLKAVSGSGIDRIAVVIGPDMLELEAEVAGRAPGAGCHVQGERLGTAHAARAASAAFADTPDQVLVLFGDTPLVSTQTLLRVSARLESGADIAVLGFHAADPTGYGRLLARDGQLLAIREERDASAEERKVDFCNSGIMGFRGARFAEILGQIGNGNAKGEYYLTDAVEIANRMGLSVVTETAEEWEVQGINTRAQLARVEADFQTRARLAAMEEGASLIAPETVFFSHDTRLGRDVLVEPNVVFGPGVVVGDKVTIRAFSHLEQAAVETGATLGPYARLRPGAKIGEGAHVGNFVEIKNASIEAGAKVNHLTYIGDARVGAKANIGAGTITCNYDGFLKHHTDIGAGVFVGSNSTLVAPLTIGEGAYLAAGGVVTEDVPANALSLGRSRQVIKEGRGEQLRARFARAKAEKQGGK